MLLNTKLFRHLRDPVCRCFIVRQVSFLPHIIPERNDTSLKLPLRASITSSRLQEVLHLALGLVQSGLHFRVFFKTDSAKKQGHSLHKSCRRNTSRYWKARQVPVDLLLEVDVATDGINQPVSDSQWDIPLVPIMKPNMKICRRVYRPLSSGPSIGRLIPLQP